jgi:hypothetical protein
MYISRERKRIWFWNFPLTVNENWHPLLYKQLWWVIAKPGNCNSQVDESAYHNFCCRERGKQICWSRKVTENADFMHVFSPYPAIENFHLSGRGEEVRQSPGTKSWNRPTVPARDNRWVGICSVKTQCSYKNLPRLLSHHKSHMDYPGTEPGSPRWDGGEWRLNWGLRSSRMLLSVGW